MQNIVLINPLKPEKLDGFKAFMTEISSARKEEYIDMLQRYGMKSSKVYYPKFDSVEFVVVVHEAEDYATERLPNWVPSTHPFDIWFKEQAQEFYDFAKAKQAGQPELILNFTIPD